MKVVLPDNRISKKRIAVYVSIIIVCVISIIIAFYVQFYARIDIARLLGFKTETELGNKTEEEQQILKAEFDDIFTNSLQTTQEKISFTPKEGDKEIIYTKLEKKENKLNNYDIEVHIPCINIDNEEIEEYNEQIEDFIDKTNSILESENKNSIYTVDYVASVKDDILSLIIRSNLKEGTNAQRVIIQTYNYDLRNNKKVTLPEILRIEALDKTVIQNKITDEIQKEQNRVEDLKKLGYNIYSRDTKSDMYKIENSEQYFLSDGVLYVIYAYGNETFTSEMDVIVI